jgi:hypothetical protein
MALVGLEIRIWLKQPGAEGVQAAEEDEDARDRVAARAW